MAMTLMIEIIKWFSSVVSFAQDSQYGSHSMN